MYVLVDDKQRITAVSDMPFLVNDPQKMFCLKHEKRKWDTLVGKRIHHGRVVMSVPAKPLSELKVAVICNWNDKCGISTYSGFLVGAMKSKVKEMKIFSEQAVDQTAPDEDFVDRCWKRGESLRPLAKRVLDWKPDFILIQHEYGIFPNAIYWMQFMQMLDETPYAVVMHSVYEHLDKAVYASSIKNIICHSEQAKACLRKLGNTSEIHVIPHGCLAPEKVPDPLWNIMHNDYTILPFGFGFRYKGVERILAAVSHLKKTDPKFKNIFYCFLLSTNGHNSRVHTEYYEALLKHIEELDIVDNVAIIRKYNSDETLNLYLREFKLAVFPYVMSEDNTVFGASGATRIAMANGIPVIVSESHLFDDFEGILPRPDSAESLAREIDLIFSNPVHRKALLDRSYKYIHDNSWDKTADLYLSVYPKTTV